MYEATPTNRGRYRNFPPVLATHTSLMTSLIIVKGIMIINNSLNQIKYSSIQIKRVFSKQYNYQT